MKTIEEYEQEYNSIQNICVCSKCQKPFMFKPDEVLWDESGFGYSTKIVKCDKCDCVNVVKHIEDYGLDVNFDNRFYSYK